MRTRLKYHLMVALLCIASTSEIRAQQPNAWQINDNLATAGVIEYLTNLTTAQVSSASTNGWRYDLVTRMISDSGSAAAHSMAFGDGTRRFYIFFDLDGSGQLTAQLLGGTTNILTSAVNATNYHSHQMTYDPVTSNATYRVDGTVIASWPGQVSVGQSNQVMWGANASAGRGVMNYHRARFEIIGEGVIASYEAGRAGNPAVAPSPTTQAWTRFTSGGALAESPVSPDAVALPVTTLAASGVQSNSVTLNALLNPGGLAAGCYFEYGSTTNYGSFTTTNTIPAGVFATNVSIVLGGLSPFMLYHFRAVISDGSGTMMGDDLSFSTGNSAPNAWEINDNLAGSGVLEYLRELTEAQVAFASTYGWRYDLVSRMISDSGSAAAHSMAFGDGTRRFYIFFDLNASGQLTAQLLGDTTYILTSAADATNYHSHQMTYDPITSNAVYRVNGVVIASWPGEVSVGQSNQVMWGANASAGRGVMDYHRAEFEIVAWGVVAKYDAGFSPDPIVAPDPTSQGWTRFTIGGAMPEGPVAPPVTTLAASGVRRDGATLHALLNPEGLMTSYYFEYGTTTNYGSFSATNTVAAGAFSMSVSSAISGLSVLTLYHFRAVISNSAGMMSGNDQTFSTPVHFDLPTGVIGPAVWGDYDNDGLQDILMAGNAGDVAISQVLRNTGSGFTNINAGLPGLFNASVAWGDCDNDGRLDILLRGSNGTNAIVQVWRNTGSGFTNINAGLPAAFAGSVAWGDYNNDGRLDILLTGHDGTNAIAQVWRNTGSGFTNINAGLPGAYTGSVAWGDYDNDGWLDILLTGFDSSNAIAQVWRNTGSGFTNVNAGLPGAYLGSAAWGDYDNDGWLDILLTGYTGSNVIAHVWRNTGNGFTNINAGLPGAYMGSAAWGDYDNDGWLDVLLTGQGESGIISQIWRNIGSGFAHINAGLPVLHNASVAWGDSDNDGRLDILLTGYDGTNSIGQVWPNLQPNTNNAPAAPSGLTAVATDPRVTLQWNPASDAETPSSGLTHNLRVGTTPGAGNVVSPEAESNGFRLLPALGNAQLRTNAFLNLEPGVYYWSVQAVDSAFAGGPFATEASFVVPPPTLAIVSDGTNAIISWQPSYPGWILQETLSLAPAAWSNAPSGPTNPVAVPVTLPTKFYRLFKP